MCWRDDAVKQRTCSECGQLYRGSLGHVGCPEGIGKKQAVAKAPQPAPVEGVNDDTPEVIF